MLDKVENDLANLSRAKKAWRIVPKFLATAAAIATVAFAAASANATTYYVSSSGGNDSNNGTSTSTPWQTTAKVNAAALVAGDQVLFKRGDNWYSQLMPSTDGAAGNPITFADYGTGTQPTFWGSNPIPSAGWTSAGTNEWTTSYTVPGGASITGVIVNGYLGVANAWMVPGNPATPGQFSAGGGTLTIYSLTNPATDGKSYTATSREDVIYSSGRQHEVFTNLIAREATDSNFGYVIRVENSNDVVFNSCAAYCGSKHVWGFICANAVTANNCDAQWGLPHNQVQGCSFYVSYADASGPYTDCTNTYNNCSGEGFTDGDGGTYEYFVCHGPDQGPIVFNNPQDNGGFFAVLQDVPQQTCLINGGTITNNDLESFCGGMVTQNVNFVGECTFDCFANNNVFQNNKMINMKEPAGGLSGYWTAIIFRSGATGNIVRFNTITLDPSDGNNSTLIAMAGANSATQAYGNIFESDDHCVINDWNGNPTSADITNTDYNVYNASPTFQPFATGGSWNFATWKTNTGQDSHTLTIDPDFNNPTGGDYTLSVYSQVINTCLFTSETPALPTTDFAGNPRLFGAHYDPGCYELQQAGQTPPAPVITSASTASGTVGGAFSYQITATNSPTSFGASPLPAGTSVNTGTGLVSGTTSTAGTTNMVVSATNAGGTGTLTVVVTVTLLAPVITNGNASATLNTAFSDQINASGNPTSYGATPLPAGLTVNTGTGLISGNPTTLGATTVGLSATNSVGTGNKNITITVGSNFNVNGIYTTGTTFPSSGGFDSFGNAYWATQLGSGCTFNGSTFTFGAANALDGWSNVVVTLPPGSYTSLNMVGSSSGGIGTNQTFTVTYTDLTTQNFTVAMKDWSSSGTNAGETIVTTMANCAHYDGTDPAGNHYLHGYTLTLNGKAVKSITLPAARGVVMLGFLPASAVPVITSALTKSGVVGTALSYQITATNSPTSYGASPLPASVTVNTGTGLISGTPSAAGTTNSTISATNANGTGTAVCVFTITSTPPPAPVITSALTATGTTGTAFSYNITATNSPTSYNATPLPGGLSVNTGTGAITGTPTTQGIYSITISATNAGGTGNATLVATIGSPVTAYNVTGIYATGQTFASTGGLDSFGHAYWASQLGTSCTYDSQTFTFGAANAVDGWNNVTVNLAPGTYTTLDMVGTASGGIAHGQTFQVNYTDGTNSVFTVQMNDWTSTTTQAGETKVVTMANYANFDGTDPAGNHVVHGYTLTLTGHSVKNIVLPTNRGVVMLGFKGH